MADACVVDRGGRAIIPSDVTSRNNRRARSVRGSVLDEGIPPATRRFVKHRDGGRCTVDGCRAATFLDAHHLTPRADGGPSDDPDQITLLCVGHHRALHLGKLVIRGKPSTGLSFEHADGSPYGARRVDAPTADLFAQTYGALCTLGFRQTDARRAVDRLRLDARLPHRLDALIRAGLALLAPPATSRG
jgi:hypothetical protein